jgi:MarR family transcriptional regulator, transcriptional regulator for hemolysin
MATQAAQSPGTQAEQPPEALAPLASDLCWLLSRASHGLTIEFTAALEQLGISPRAHSVLFTAMTGEFTQTEIAKMVGLDKTTMVVTVDELERAGLAERRPSSTDRRARVVEVTNAGVRLVCEADEVLDRVRDDVLSVLEPDDRHVFLRALGTLACGRLAEPAACAHPPRRRA